MNGNSSKQVLLSVLGIAVLVVAVVGVSFAFFTYSKDGKNNNTLTTGSIFFQYTEGQYITLKNQFPVSDVAGMALTTDTKTDGEDDHTTLQFTVTGTNSSTKPINYTVYATTGNTEYATTSNAAVNRTRLGSDEVKLYLYQRRNDTEFANDSANGFENYFNTITEATQSTPKSYGALVSSRRNQNGGQGLNNTGDIIELATGRIPGSDNLSSPRTDTVDYELHMWIPETVVTIGNTRDAANHVYSNGRSGTAGSFADLYYSLKVNVSANAVN